MNKQKYIVLTVISVFAFILITSGVTYAFFSYISEGSTENTIESKSITFIYEEVNKMGNGISITDALPIPDSEGKQSNNYFDFKVTSTTGTTLSIPYEITTRITEGSDDISDYVKLYLTKMNGNNEQQVALSIYSDLNDSTNTLAKPFGDKTLYNGEIPVGSTNYIENYRLRMWLNNDSNDGSVLDYSPIYVCSDTQYTDKATCEANNGIWNPTETYNNQDKTFSIKINVYANGAQATSQSITSANTTTINTISAGNQTAVQNSNTNLNYDYSMNVANEVTEVDLNIVPASDGATVTVTPITEQEATSLRQISLSTTVQLNEGDNYFKVDVTSANRQNTETYVVKVFRAYTSSPFVTDTWEEIVYNVTHDNADRYAPVADSPNYNVVREIELTNGQKKGIRVANTTPCTTETSQTACGFVIEFVDSYYGTVYSKGQTIGDYGSSPMNSYLTGTFYNLLPQEIKDSIISTHVVTGANRVNSADNLQLGTDYFESDATIYSIDVSEVYTGNLSTNYNFTRRLDYYSLNTAAYKKDKQYSGRSAYSGGGLLSVETNGTVNTRQTSFSISANVYMAFRIG